MTPNCWCTSLAKSSGFTGAKSTRGLAVPPGRPDPGRTSRAPDMGRFQAEATPADRARACLRESWRAQWCVTAQQEQCGAQLVLR